MSFSRLSVLAVFLMMIMSAFVAISTYDVGADEPEGGPYLNAFPTGSGGDIEDYEMHTDENGGGASITVEATELIEETSYWMDWYIFTPIIWSGGVWEMAADAQNVAEGEWFFDSPPTSVEYFIEQEVFDELGTGCYMFLGRLSEYDSHPQTNLVMRPSFIF